MHELVNLNNFTLNDIWFLVSEPEAGSRRRQRLSQSLSALELSMVEFENDENHAARKPVAHLDATLPSEKPTLHVLGDLSSSLSPSVRTLQSVGQQSTSARKSSPIRAFLTPPLMRKRKVPSSKHLHHDDDNGSDSRLSPHQHTTAGNVLPSSRSKSFGFLSLLKVNPRAMGFPFILFFFVHLCLSLVPFLFEYLLTVTHFFFSMPSKLAVSFGCVNSSSFLIEVVVASSSQSFSPARLSWLGKKRSRTIWALRRLFHPCVSINPSHCHPRFSEPFLFLLLSLWNLILSQRPLVRHFLICWHRERERCEQQRNMKAPLADQEDCDDIHPQLCASAGLSLVAVAAASTVMPRLAMPKKVSISSKHTFTPHSSLDHPSSADFKHGVSYCLFFLNSYHVSCFSLKNIDFYFCFPSIVNLTLTLYLYWFNQGKSFHFYGKFFCPGLQLGGL